MSQCKHPLKCQCDNWDGGTCGTTAHCLRDTGHSGLHSYNAWHECWHGKDTWHKVKQPRTRERPV